MVVGVFGGIGVKMCVFNSVKYLHFWVIALENGVENRYN